VDRTWTKADNVEVVSVTSSCYVSEPIVHIFSHEKHTMYVMVEDVEITMEAPEEQELRLTPGRSETAWRTESDIVTAGITTGVKKILAAIKASADGKSGNETRKRSSASSASAAGGSRSTGTSGRTKRSKSSSEDTASVRSGSVLNLEKFLFKAAAADPSQSAAASATCLPPPPRDMEVIDLID
jgi:hypothetical protein